MASLFDRVQVGSLELPNRIIMGPMTRARAGAGDAPTALNATYYAQRASAGLIVSEGTYTSRSTCGFEKAPGIYTSTQAAGWKLVADEVHQAGGRLFVQLWHCGRVGAACLLDGQEPLSPAGINDDLHLLNVWGLLANGAYARIHASHSRAMTLEEIRSTVEEYRLSAQNAMAAGADGVEVHAASGYLPHQFLAGNVNRRTDRYGGSPLNRTRFLLEIVEAIGAVVPLDRVGVRISPYAIYNNCLNDDHEATYGTLVSALDRLGVAYLHLADQNGWFGSPDLEKILAIVRPRFGGPLIANGGITPAQAAELVARGKVDLASFGRLYISNPDLVERLHRGVPTPEPKSTGWYATGELGYTDYPRHVPTASSSVVA